MKPLFFYACGLAVSSLSCPQAFAFTHVVKPGETLAQIAERFYGDSKLETVLVGANALDAQGGTVIAPGMRLDVPAPGHHTVLHGETWADLSLTWLGSRDIGRAELLARANKGVSWVPPVEGQEIEIPAVLTYLAGDGETVDSIAARYWGNANLGWELNTYNHREGMGVKRGEVVLVPLTKLRLTDAAKAEARQMAERDGAGGGIALEQQRHADAELPQIAADLRSGRYVEVVGRGNRLLGRSALTHPQLAAIQRALVEAYVALDAREAAAAACIAWKSNDLGAALDPVRVSPKVIAACEKR